MDQSHRPEADRDFGFDTRQVHAGQRPDPNTGARVPCRFTRPPVTSSRTRSRRRRISICRCGNTYSRIMNPTVSVFEERMASLEGGCGASRSQAVLRRRSPRCSRCCTGRSRRVVGRALRRHRESVQARAAEDERRPDVGESR